MTFFCRTALLMNNLLLLIYFLNEGILILILIVLLLAPTLSLNWSLSILCPPVNPTQQVLHGCNLSSNANTEHVSSHSVQQGCNQWIFSLSINLPNIFKYQLINHLFHEMSKKCWKCSSHFPWAKCNVYKSLLSSKQPKTQKLLTYFHQCHRKAAKSYI